MKIMLAQPRLAETKGPYIPYSQLALAAHIEDAAEVVITGTAPDGTLPTCDAIMEQVVRDQPETVGITVGAALAYSTSVQLAKRVKDYNPDIRVIAGGHHATFTTQELLDTGHFDAVFLGEGEVSLREYVRAGDYRKVPGVVYKHNGELQQTGRAPLIDMDEVRPPAYHFLDRGMRILLGAETSRGCPFKCDFCETTVFFGNRRLRKKSTKQVIEDLKHIVDDTGGGNFLLMDDCFSADMQGHVRPICEAIVAEELPMNFIFQARLSDMYSHQELVPLLVRAGFASVIMGVETIHPETLKAMDKGATYGPKEIGHIIKLCKDNGMAFFASICFGYPGETTEMVAKTVEYIISLDVDCANITLATPVPGSPLYDRALKNGELLSHDYDLYNGATRLLSTIPEEIADAMYQGIRRFYLRPEYISRNIERAIDPATADWRSFTAAGVMSFNIATDKARPRTSEEWTRLVQGLALVLENHKDQLDQTYSGTVRLVIDSSATLHITVENGRPSYVGPSDNKADFDLLGSGETYLDMLVWSGVDIVSACILGSVRTEGGTLEQRIGFIRWLTGAQTVLRWSIAMLGCVPVLRSTIEDWLSENKPNARGIKELFNDGGPLFLGQQESGNGIVIDFQDGMQVSDVYLALKNPDNTKGEIDLDDRSLEKILDGDTDLFIDSLDKEIRLTSAEQEVLITQADFFAGLHAKFKPDRAENVDVLVQYQIQGEQESPDLWCVKIKEQQLTVHHSKASEKPTAYITSTEEAFRRLINGKGNPAVMFNRGEMLLKGLPQTILRMASCFDRLFGKPAST